MEELIQSVPGAQQLFEWFGYWPSFHDAEVLSIELNRSGLSIVRVHAFNTIDAVDSKGFYICDKHCIATFLLDDLTGVELADFNHQNVLSSLRIHRENDEFILILATSYGVAGLIKAKSLRIELAAGIPEDSQYKQIGA